MVAAVKDRTTPGERLRALITEARSAGGTAQNDVFDAVWADVLADEELLKYVARIGLIERIRNYGSGAKRPVLAMLKYPNLTSQPGRTPNAPRGVKGAQQYVQAVKDTLYETFEVGKGLLLGEATRMDLRNAIYQAAGQASGHMVRLQFLRQLEKRMPDDTTKVAAAIPLKDAEMLYHSTEKAVGTQFQGRLVSNDPPGP